MPIYEYECTACMRRMERMQKLSDPPPTVCEHCGGTLRRIFSPSALVFKGSGWYVTDYARQGEQKPGGKTDPAGSQEAKPETKAESSSPAEKTAPPAPPKTQ